MLFNSIHYLFFFPAVTSIYFLMPYRWRWAFLLLASYYFFMAWVPVYAALKIASTLVTYVTAIGLGASEKGRTRKTYLAICVAANLGLLVVFKYYNFFIGSFNSMLGAFHIQGSNIPALNVLLPVGISFYTFQALGYIIDVYRGRVKPERHLGIFAIYVSFFPQLVAGPIERPYHMLPQYRRKFDFDSRRVAEGLKLMVWGYFMKVVIADNLATYVNAVYNDPRHHTGTQLLIATYLFAFQIFCDFAGYTDIAIGSARVMGFELMENFNRPYFSKSIAEFWRRWHISLSTWFRDYLYIPMGGNRVAPSRWLFNIMFVFLVCGLWHGASWTFVIWGGLHGFYMASSILTKKFRVKAEEALGLGQHTLLMKTMKVLITFNLVCFAWIFFRANSLPDAWYITTHIFTGLTSGLPADEKSARLVFYGLLIAFLLYVQLLERKTKVSDYIITKPVFLKWAVYAVMVLAIFFLGEFSGSDFIYFQF